MSIGTESQTDSVYLSSSVSSLQRPKKTTSEISKTYKHASQLYLTRRLAECYEALQPVIKRVTKSEQTNGSANGNSNSNSNSNSNGNGNDNVSQSEDDSAPRALIASASTSQRIKIWSLYATLLNAIVELDDDEGKRDFGNKQYRELVRLVQSGEVWEQVVRDGYLGRDASVDAEVVYNLSNLLLAQAPNQSANQARLETYLASASQSSIDFSSAFQNGNKQNLSTNGMDTPKDLNSRIKILELFVLHVLPANSEWDYARSFVSNSDILDEERREAFLQTLNELQEAKEQEEAEAATEPDLVGFAEETEDEYTDAQQDRIHMNDGDNHNNNQHQQQTPNRKSLHRRTSSEVDYGIDDDLLKARSPQRPSPTHFPASHTEPHAQPTPTTAAQSRTISPSPAAPTPSITSRSTLSSPPPTIAPPARKPTTAQPARRSPATGNAGSKKSTSTNNGSQTSQFSQLVRVITNLAHAITSSISRNPAQVFRTLMFLVVFITVLARRDVRERLKRVMGVGWNKVAATAGMGVKVSYV